MSAPRQIPLARCPECGRPPRWYVDGRWVDQCPAEEWTAILAFQKREKADKILGALAKGGGDWATLHRANRSDWFPDDGSLLQTRRCVCGQEWQVLSM